jgi:hypothetical protein
MGQRIGVARTAQLLGISRRELQALIRNGELKSFDGELDYDELKSRYPRLTLDDSPALERAYFIRKTAFSRRVRETVTPDRDTLETQLRKHMTELAVQKARAERYHEVLEAMMGYLAELQRSEDERCRTIAGQLNRWLLDLLEKPES